MRGHRQVEQAALFYEFSLDKLSFPKIPSDLNWHDEVESLHRQGRCLRSFMHSGCLSSIYSSRAIGLTRSAIILTKKRTATLSRCLGDATTCRYKNSPGRREDVIS